MVEIPLDSIYTGGEEATGRLWQMMKNPEPIEQELKKLNYPRPIEVWKTSLVSSRSSGSVGTTITPDGSYSVEVAYKQGHDAENTTYAEETLHLLQELLNPIYFQEVEIREKVTTQLSSLGLEMLPNGFANIYTSSYLKNVEHTITSFAESVGVPSMQEQFLSERALLLRLFTSSLKSPGLFLDKSIVVNIAMVAKQWGFEILSDSERDAFIEERQLWARHIDQIRKLPTNRLLEEFEALEDAQKLERKPVESRMKEALQHIVEKVEMFSDEETRLLFSNLGLLPLLTLENYTIARDFLSKSDPIQTKSFLRNYLQNADSVRLEKIHYLLRPAAYSEYPVSNVDWLNTQEDKKRRVQSLERLENYHQDALTGLLVQLLDEELSQLWIEGEAEQAILTHPMFWDVPNDSSLATNPEYIKLNVEAIRAALASGEIELPTVLTAVSKMTENDFVLLPYEITQQHDPHAALLLDRVQDEKRKRDMCTRNTWEIFAARVGNYLNEGIEILMNNPSIPSLNYLIERLVGISYIQQGYTSINTLNHFLSELTAKSIKMYLLNQKEELGEKYRDTYPFLLTSTKPEVHSKHIGQPESIWEELVDQIIYTLQNTEEDGELIRRIIQAENIREVTEIVGYQFAT